MCSLESNQHDVMETLLAFPVIQAIRKAYNNPHITFAGNPTVLPLALATGLVDEASDFSLLQWSSLFSSSRIHSPAVLDQLQRTDLAICWLRDPDGTLAQNLGRAGVRNVIVAPGRPAEGQHTHLVACLAQTIGPHK